MTTVAVLGFAIGCAATWLYRDWRARWSEQATSAIVRGILIAAEHGQDVVPMLRDLAAAYQPRENTDV